MSHTHNVVKCDQPLVEGHAERDYAIGHAESPAALRASQLWSGASAIGWSPKNQDYPSSVECGSPYAIATSASHPPFEGAPFGRLPGEGTPYDRPTLDPQIAQHMGRAFADPTMPPPGFAHAGKPDKPEFWRNVGHNIGETVKHIVMPWTNFTDV